MGPLFWEPWTTCTLVIMLGHECAWHKDELAEAGAPEARPRWEAGVVSQVCRSLCWGCSGIMENEMEPTI